MNDPLRFYTAMTNAQLLDEVQALTIRHRDVNASLVAALGEVDVRQLYLSEGYPSLYSYCTQHLHLSEHAAYNRIEAARTARRFPIVLDMLAAGDVSMTTVSLLSRYLTGDNHLGLLEAARHKSKREVQEQIAALGPLPDPGSVLRPLGNDRYRLEVTLGSESYKALRRLQDLMRHTIPTGEPAEIVSRSLLLQLVHVERQRLAGVRRPQGALRVSRTRYVPAAVRRKVWERDESRCAFVGAQGRCPERAFLELHHVIPFAKGGRSSVDNLQLRCRAHNVYESDQQPQAG
jgi:5-methylcytosine-specific restriction endonuclease McrA